MILVRACNGFEELEACVDLQIEVWGYCEGDVIPRRAFLVAQKIGGQVFGAFDTALTGAPEQGDAASMVGFALSLPGVKTGPKCLSGHPESYLHSHMLAVKDGYRNQGIGARLKLAQRDEAIGRGIDRIEWTFDPLEIKNAFLNIHKLGAIVRSYEPDFYGISSSRLQGGLPTDRLVAEWWLISPRVVAAIGACPSPLQNISSLVAARQIVVPAAIYQWKNHEQHRSMAHTVQAENRHMFEKAFSEGLTVVDFTKDAEGNGIFHLGRWHETEN